MVSASRFRWLEGVAMTVSPQEHEDYDGFSEEQEPLGPYTSTS